MMRARHLPLLLAALPCIVLAQTPPAAEPDLYVEAMRAISEGRTEDAGRALSTMLTKGPNHASEWLDLAMVQCAIGHGDDAEKLFRTIEERFNPPQGIRDIINQQRSQGCRKWTSQQQYSFSVAQGYDRNVNQGASNPFYTLGGNAGNTLELLPEYLPKADAYLSASGDYKIQLSESGLSGFVQGALRRNTHLSSYNTASVFGGIEQPWQVERWKLRGAIVGGALTLGGSLYQEQAQLQLQATPPLSLPNGLEWSLQGSLSRVTYKTLTNFDSYTEDLRSMLSMRGSQHYSQISIGYQNDHARNTRPGGDRSGWTFNLSDRRRLSQFWQSELDLSRQTWNSTSSYSLPLIDTVRRQDTRVARAALVYLLGERQAIQLEARHVQNKDNISFFQYSNTVFQLSWHWSGQ